MLETLVIYILIIAILYNIFSGFVGGFASELNKSTTSEAYKKIHMVQLYLSTSEAIIGIINQNKTVANIFKTCMYLLISQIAIIEKISKGNMRVSIEKMTEDIKNELKEYRIVVKELANNTEELDKILSFFEIEHGVDGDTTINGYAAFLAIHETYTVDLVLDIIKHSGNDGSKIYLYASEVILKGLTGKHAKNQDLLDISQLISDMTGRIIKLLR